MKRIDSYINTIFEESEIIKSGGMVFSASLVGSVILFIANLLLSKHFGPEGFGNFKTVIYLSLLLSSTIELGAGITLTKYIAEFSKDRINYIVRWFLKLRIVSYLILLCIIFIFREKIALYFLNDPSLSNLIMAGMLLSALVFFDIFKFISLGFQNFRLYSFSQFLTLTSAGIFTLIFGYLFGIYYAIIGWGLGYLIGNLPNIRFSFAKKIFKKTDVRLDVKKIFLNYSMPIHLMIIPGFIGNAIIPILSLFFSQRLIGYYSFAMVFYQGVISIPNALSSVLLPRFSELNGSDNLNEARIKLKRIFLIYTPIVILGIIFCILFSELFLSIVASAYLPGLLIFKTLVCFGLFVGYLLIYRSYLTGLAKLRRLTIIVIFHNISLFILSFIIMKLIS